MTRVRWSLHHELELLVCSVLSATLACTEPATDVHQSGGASGGAMPPASGGVAGAHAGSASGGASGGAGLPAAGGGAGASSSGAGASGEASAPQDEPSTFFGSSRCARAGLLLCDGFEGDTIDSSLWKVEESGENLVELDAGQAARGTKSLRIHASNGFGFIRNESLFPLPDNDYYGRIFVRVARFSQAAWAHWTLVEAAGTGNGSKIRIGGQYRTDEGKNRWGVGSDGGPTGDWTTPDDDPDGLPVEPPVNAWVCLEWLHQGSTNVTRFFVDGEEHPSLATTAQEHGGNRADYVLPQFQSLWVGWWQYQADPKPFEVWIDEVAFDDERIGCVE